MQKKPFASPIDIIITLGMAWWLNKKDVGHWKRLSCQHKKWSGRRGIEVLPGQSSWEQFPGSSWEKLAEAQEREEKRERCSQPKKRLISCCYGDSWYQRRQMQKEEKTIAWLRGKSMIYFTRASCTSRLWGHQRWLQCDVGTLRETNVQGGLCFAFSLSSVGSK